VQCSSVGCTAVQRVQYAFKTFWLTLAWSRNAGSAMLVFCSAQSVALSLRELLQLPVFPAQQCPTVGSKLEFVQLLAFRVRTLLCMRLSPCQLSVSFRILMCFTAALTS
jgi:hypothetical protein